MAILHLTTSDNLIDMSSSARSSQEGSPHSNSKAMDKPSSHIATQPTTLHGDNDFPSIRSSPYTITVKRSCHIRCDLSPPSTSSSSSNSNQIPARNFLFLRSFSNSRVGIHHSTRYVSILCILPMPTIFTNRLEIEIQNESS